MIKLIKQPNEFYIEDPDAYLAHLTYAEIKPYVKYLKEFGVHLVNTTYPDCLTPKEIPIKGLFGYTVLANIATGFAICLIAMIAISKKQKVCFQESLLGENALIKLCEIARGTQYVYLFNESGDIQYILDEEYEKEILRGC